MPTQSNANKAILLLGHGSKAPEANETLRKVAASVKERGGYGYVLPAFLQMVSPNFQEGVDMLTEKGFSDIIVMPYFLYMGLHVTQDLPAEMDEAQQKHPGLKMTLTRNLGYHNKLIDITIERIEELNKDKADVKSPYDQHPIEKESFRLIGEELDESQFSALELPVVKRVIHSTADFEFKDLMRLSPNAIQAGIEAIKNGCNIITDVKMVLSGITKNRLEPFGAQVYCFSSDEDVARLSTEENITKTSASMRKASKFMQGGIVAIGNAPTALFELLKIINNGGPKPALIVGVPVGFVGAAESKEELMKSGCEYIATAGRKGGSTVAVAIVNAIAISAGTLTPTK